MQRVDGRLVLSPTDLTKHVACPHVTTLDLASLGSGAASGAKAPDDALNLIFAKGLLHEAEHLQTLRDRGLRVVEIEGFGSDRRAAEEATVAAMRDGADVIYQATLYDGRWVGHADFLLRRERPSALGAWSYDIADTKLARRLKVPALLQMATYAERLAELQGAPPEQLVVVTGDKVEHPWRLVDVDSYTRRLRGRLIDAIETGVPTESAPVAYCGQCRWEEHCESEWLAADDLVQVAGLRGDQRKALRDKGIRTLAQLAAQQPADLAGVLSSVTRDRLVQQARLQLAEREGGQRRYELLEPQPRRGLQRLPEPSPGDVYLDFEGDPWAEGGSGREYLAGLWDRSGTFTPWWAHDFAQEKLLTEGLVDELIRRWQADPDMHIYHYAAYERTALQRLTGRHGTREAELDQLLRAERLVDLYAVVKQGIRISKPSYSIKKLEDFYWQHTRSAQDDDEVADAMTSVVKYEQFLVERDESILDALAHYNSEDVRSTHDLHRWLEQLRAELETGGHHLSRPTPEEPEPVSDAELAETELADRLLGAGHELLAGCVGWHRREARPAWWDFFRYRDLDDEQLFEDATAVGAPGAPVHVRDVVSGTGRVTSRIWRYPFPPQDCKLMPGTVHDVDTHESVGTLVAIDPVEGWLELKLGKAREPQVPRGFGPPGPIGDQVLRDSIAAAGERVLAGESPLAARLIARTVPPAEMLAALPGEEPKDVVVRVGQQLSGQVLAVQGPPGTGKTYAGSELVRALLDRGLKVGVTALSHTVIRQLLDKIDRPALHKVTKLKEPAARGDADGGPPSDVEGSATSDVHGRQVREVTSNEEVADALADGSARLVGGTAWLWAREDLRTSVDVLLIDEAGQFSLANAVAVSSAASSLVLLGDPQQLTQPTQAAHPHGAGVSALDHLLGGHDTIPADRGVFLDHTRRMHPDITRFVSDISYDGRLESKEGLAAQQVAAPGRLSGSGLQWVPVEQDGCLADSPAEAEAVAGLVEDLLQGEWTDQHGVERPMTVDDLLVVAPYNAHLSLLRRVLPAGVRAGTVDKFQGQEAPVVIYTMASSSAALAPRGVDFLYDPHRLNVAVSRARALTAIVCNPALLDAEVHSPEQLRAVNALCRYVEQAEAAASVSAGA